MKQRIKHSFLFTLVLCMIVSVAMPVMSSAATPTDSVDQRVVTAVNGAIKYLEDAVKLNDGEGDKLDFSNADVIDTLKEALDKYEADPNYETLRYIARTWEAWVTGGHDAHNVFITDTLISIVAPLEDVFTEAGIKHPDQLTEGDDLTIFERDSQHFGEVSDPSTVLKSHPIKNDIRDKKWKDRDAYHRNMYKTLCTEIKASPDNTGNYDKVAKEPEDGHFVKVGNDYYVQNTSKKGAYVASENFGHPVDENGKRTCTCGVEVICHCGEPYAVTKDTEPDKDLAKRTTALLLDHLIRGKEAEDDEWDNPVYTKIDRKYFVDAMPSDFIDGTISKQFVDAAKKMDEAKTAKDAYDIFYEEIIGVISEKCTLKSYVNMEKAFARAHLLAENTSGDPELLEELKMAIEYFEEEFKSIDSDGYASYPKSGITQYRPASQSTSFLEDIKSFSEKIDVLRGEFEGIHFAYEETCTVPTDYSSLEDPDDPYVPVIKPGQTDNNNDNSENDVNKPQNTADATMFVFFILAVSSVALVTVLAVAKKRYNK